MRARLLFIRNEVEQGADVWDSLHDAKLLSAAEAHALAISSTPAVRSWLMQGLANQKRERTILLAEAIARAVQLFVILLIAATVLLLSLAIYQYLVACISMGLH
jgi:hypothetical protein